MQPTKIKTSILTATGLITHTTEFRVEGAKYVADLADGDRIEIYKEDGSWEVSTPSVGLITVVHTRQEAMIRAAGEAMQLAMCTD
jgi:3-dehydroquinate synthase class II